MKISQYWKAVVAAVTAGAGAFATAASDDVISNGEWTTIGLAVLAALAATYRVPNREPSNSQ